MQSIMRLHYICVNLLCLLLIKCKSFRVVPLIVPNVEFRLSASILQEKILLFNSASRIKEKFQPLNYPKVSFYSCGPTVYDFAHIGNFRAFLTYDLLKRWLTYCSYDVNHVCNLTDIDDKILIKMKHENKSLKEVTEKYSKAFFEDLEVNFHNYY